MKLLCGGVCVSGDDTGGQLSTHLFQLLTWTMVPAVVGKLSENTIPPSGLPACRSGQNIPVKREWEPGYIPSQRHADRVHPIR